MEDIESLKKSKGEVIQILDMIKKESQAMMQHLLELDNMLNMVQEKAEKDTLEKEELLKTIQNIRVRIGAIETEDQREMKEEEIADNLLNKLKKWVDLVV